MREINEMMRQLRTGGLLDPLQEEAAKALSMMHLALHRIAESRDNQNWRKPEICDEARRVLEELK